MRIRGGGAAAVLVIGLLAGCAPGQAPAGPQGETSASRITTLPGASPGSGTGDGSIEGPGNATQEGSTAATTDAPRPERGIVTHVVDGDTIDVDGVGRIRVIGIDTPERGACGFESATLAMAALVAGREVVLTPGAQDDVDRYDRLLRYVDVDGTDAGLSLVEDGWAVARYDSRDGYGRHAREDRYVAADLAAPDLGCYDEDE